MQHHPTGLPPQTLQQQQLHQQLQQHQQAQQAQQAQHHHATSVNDFHGNHNGGGAPRIGISQAPYGSPQRRFLSEGELVRQGAELSYARTNNTVDNIRELAGSPQRGVYMWKDNSPGFNGNHQPQFPGQPNIINRTQPNSQHEYNQHNDPYHHRSNPTSPTQHLQYTTNNIGQRYPPMQSNASGGPYNPAIPRGGVSVFPPQPSPQIKRKATPTRPISFVRALEMTDSMEMTAMNGGNCEQQQQQQQSNQSRNNGPISNTSGGQTNMQRSTTPTPDRQSVYDMNYEISV